MKLGGWSYLTVRQMLPLYQNSQTNSWAIAVNHDILIDIMIFGSLHDTSDGSLSYRYTVGDQDPVVQN